MINLFYLSPNSTGGWVTFTAHLANSLAIEGEEVNLYKVGKNTEAFARPFGYGLHYRNLSRDDAIAIARRQPSIIVAVQKNYNEIACGLIAHGAKVVLHDPTELSAGLAGARLTDPWVIRKAVQRRVPGSVFIRHPYVRRPAPAKTPKKRGAVSISRIDFDKHTDMILDANRLGAKIDIRGFENRLYTKFKIMPNYPEWEQSVVHYPRGIDTAYELLLGAKFMVDMSVIKGDGGGTQYTFLEAWDAGAVPVINERWPRKGDDMNPHLNCKAVVTPKEIKDVVRRQSDMSSFVAAGEKQLKKHAPKIIVPQVMEWLK